MPPLPFDFPALIHPVDPTTFFRDYWEQRPLILHRRSPEHYRTLFGMTDVDQVLHACRPGPQEILVMKNQDRLETEHYLTAAGTVKMGELYAAYDDGYTIVLNGLERFWHPLAKLSQSIQHFLNHRVAANMYLSPRHSVGLKPHYDTHDILVLQTDGTKLWSVHERAHRTPLVGSEQPLLSEKEMPPLSLEVPLEAGDLMYLPRGFVHHAATAETGSLHVTIGIYPTQWVDLLTHALRALSLEDERLRRALPPGFIDRPELLPDLREHCRALAEHFAAHASPDAGVASLIERFLSETIPVPDGHFRQVEKRETIGSDTRVAKRPGLMCQVDEWGARGRIRFPGKAISGPRELLSSLKFIAQVSSSFTVRELPGEVSEEKKIALVRRLVRGGLLKAVLDDDTAN